MYFELDIIGNVETKKCLPLFTKQFNIRGHQTGLLLVGGFLVKKGDKVGFFASDDSWLKLVSGGGVPLFFKPMYDGQGVIIAGELIDAKDGADCVQVVTSEVDNG